jgi:antitoxin Phd
MGPKISKKPASRDKQSPPSSQRWQLQTAKAQFSEVFRRARERAPQVVTRQDKEAVVIVAIEEFERLTKRDKQPKSLSKFFAESPLAKVPIDLERKPDYGRTVEL